MIAGVTTQYIWIGGDAYTAAAVAQKVGTGGWTVYNIFRDHLGTITHLKNGSNAADEYSFDAWGRRRDKDDWTTTLTSEPALFADRGFTGHEYLEDFNLYNMNGRLYDPVVGRFLSADPVVQDPTFTQSMNRYSYCLNNPLKFTDPSGEIPWLFMLGQFAGNYLFNMADNTINKGMPLNKAATQFNFNMNYNPGTNRFSTPGVDAQMAARNQEKGGGSSYRISGYFHEIRGYVGYDDFPVEYNSSYWKYVPSSGGGNGGWYDNAGVIIAGMALTVEDVYNNFGHNHTSYPTTKNIMKNFSDFKGRELSLQALKYSRISKIINFTGTIGTGLMTSQAGTKIYNGNASGLDYSDFLVGSTGLLNAGALQWTTYGTPVVGEGVALYSWGRLWLDLGANYGPIGAYYGINKWSGR